MPIPSFENRRVSKILEHYCRQAVPPHAQDQVELRFRFEGNNVLLYEHRAPWDGVGAWTDSMIAKFRYFVGRNEWVLYCRDRNARWHRYDLIAPSRVFEDLLSEVDKDPTAIFWG